MARQVHNGMDIVDSRDIIARIRELETAREDAIEQAKRFREGGDTGDLDANDLWAAEDGTEFMGPDWDDDTEHELQALKSLAGEASSSPDWEHGETLIRDSYFEEYAQELAEDIGAINRDARWPNNHIDWEAAADELKNDYFQVEWDGETYWIRA